MNKAAKIMGIVILIVAIIGGWYNFYYIKTPEYSLDILQEAVKKHDVEKFKKHVDLESVLSNSVDDLFAIEFKDKVNNEAANEFAKGLVAVLKPTIVSTLKTEIIKSVETGTWQINENTGSSSDNSTADNKASASMISDIGAKDVSFNSMQYVKKDGDISHTGIEIITPALSTPFTLDFQMNKNDDGTWKITKITNFKEYAEEIVAAKKDDLKKYIELTKPIVDENNARWLETNKLDDKTLVEKRIELSKERLEKFEVLDIPYGARELHELRKQVQLLDIDYYTYLSTYINSGMTGPLPKEIQEKVDLREELDNKVRIIIEDNKN